MQPILYTTGLRETIDLGTLADYITEAGNPGNKRQVASVELAYPSSFLETGIVLIDTPGIGSTHAHNTRTTEGYLEQVDAAIVVFSVDPPITEVESEFLRRIKEEMPKLFFILNKNRRSLGRRGVAYLAFSGGRTEQAADRVTGDFSSVGSESSSREKPSLWRGGSEWDGIFREAITDLSIAGETPGALFVPSPWMPCTLLARSSLR